MTSWSRSEFEFELLVCRWVELAWPVDLRESSPIVVARQLGTRSRRWDTLVIECDPDGLRRRRAFGDRELDRDLLFVLQHAPASWEWYRDALPHPGYPWRYVRETVHRAADRDILRTRRNGNRIEIERRTPFPDWVERIVAIENKPNLDASAARALSDQLDHDVDSGLIDEVWVATAATDDRVPPALLEAMPVEVGIVAMDVTDGVSPTSGDVLWNPLGRRSTDTTTSGSDDGPLSSRRLELAERAYGRGWRSYHRTMRTDCRWYELDRHGYGLLPRCGAKRRCQRPRECSASCPSFEPEPPGWRIHGYPIDGGPGKGIVQLLERRQKRERKRELQRERDRERK